MKIIADTTNKDFFLALLNDQNQIIQYFWLKDIKHKVELLDQKFKELLITNNLQLKNIKKFYLTIGPGLFTGVRISLIYFQTLAYLNKIELHTCDSFIFLDASNLLIDARGGTAYQKNNNQIQLIKVNDQTIFAELDYLKIIQNFAKYQNYYELQPDLFVIEPIYIKAPQIGAKKW